MHKQSVAHDLVRARYASLRSFRRDGTAVDTPIWFALQDGAVVFRTKIGPKTARLQAHPEVELTACDHRGAVTSDAETVAGVARLLIGIEAERANEALRHRYGWQYNIVPLIKIPGVTNVHADLSLGEKIRRARHHGVWPDSAIVRVDLTPDRLSLANPDTDTQRQIRR